MNETKIKISIPAYLKLKYYTLNCDKEIGGLLIVSPTDPLLIDDIVLVDQEVTSSSIDYNIEELHKLLNGMVLKDKTILERVKGTWHSHASMGSFMSGTDNHTALDLSKSALYNISIVTNHKMEIIAQLTANIKGVGEFIKEDIKVDLNIDDPQLKEACIKEIKAKVKEPITKTWGTYGSQYQNKWFENWEFNTHTQTWTPLKPKNMSKKEWKQEKKRLLKERANYLYPPSEQTQEDKEEQDFLKSGEWRKKWNDVKKWCDI